MTWSPTFQLLLYQCVVEGTNLFSGLLHFTLDTYLIVLSVKQGGIKYHFFSLWFDSTWDQTTVSQAIGKHYPQGQLQEQCCWIHYIGKSEWPYYFRLNNYSYRITSLNYNKLILVEQHFHSNDCNCDVKFIIRKRILKKATYIGQYYCDHRNTQMLMLKVSPNAYSKWL